MREAILEDGSVVPVSQETWTEFRRFYRSLGPRHTNMDRWVHDYGWHIAPNVRADYLKPETAS